ncbi:MAG: hypothetical protein ABSF70_03390 [Terracidiphilus sp.]
MLIVLFSLVDLPVGNGLYVNSVASLDNSYRVEVVAQLARTSQLPPLSPFFAGNSSAVVLRYHYFWFMACGLIPKLTGWQIGARDALNASVVWLGFLLLAVLGLYWKLFFKVKHALRQSVASVPVLLLGGLQGPIFLVLVLLSRHSKGSWQLGRHTLTRIDWLGQITYWLDSLLWVPHCVASVLAALIALLALYEMHKSASWRERMVLVLAASFSLASSVGLSVFVCVPFFAYLGLLCAWQLFKGRDRRLGFELACALGLSVLFIAPYLWSMRAPAGSPFPLALSMRPSALAGDLAMHVHDITPAARQLLNLVIEPVIFFFELGMMAVIAVWAFAWRKPGLDAEGRNRDNLIGLFVLVTTVIVLFVNSIELSGGTNDLGWRAPLGALFFLIFYGVRFFDGWRSDGLRSLFSSWASMLRPVFVILIVLGFATTFTEFMLLRFYFVVDNTRETGDHTYDLRVAMDFLRHVSYPEAVVQLNPTRENAIYSGLFMERGTVLREAGIDSHFDRAIPLDLRLSEENEIKPIFENTGLHFDQIQQRCTDLGINYLVIRSGDAGFSDVHSWVWQVTPIFADQSVRIYRC